MPELNPTQPHCEFQMEDLVIKLDEVIPSAISMIDPTVAKILGLIGESPCSDNTENLELVLREALANAIIHGNRKDPNKPVRICVAMQSDCRLLIIVKDAGSGFDLSEVPNPLVGQNLIKEHGRGIFLINRLMDDVHFSFERGTSIHMRRTLAKRQ
jgi:serine/threonine-protein kinase RsbW